jgi:23S rRNA pseudouridine2457 synthase
MVSQFISPDDVKLLGHLNFSFPAGTHAIGRLDNNSEGLLILTTNKAVTRLLFQGHKPHTRTYLAQLNGHITSQNLRQLQMGVSIRVKGGRQWKTTACAVAVVQKPEYHFVPPELERAYPPYTWIRLSLTEGKFHQVRKMIAAVHHKCRRLIRVAIEDIYLGDLGPGGVKELPEDEFFKLLHIKY